MAPHLIFRCLPRTASASIALGFPQESVSNTQHRTACKQGVDLCHGCLATVHDPGLQLGRCRLSVADALQTSLQSGQTCIRAHTWRFLDKEEPSKSSVPMRTSVAACSFDRCPTHRTRVGLAGTAAGLDPTSTELVCAHSLQMLFNREFTHFSCCCKEQGHITHTVVILPPYVSGRRRSESCA